MANETVEFAFLPGARMEPGRSLDYLTKPLQISVLHLMHFVPNQGDGGAIAMISVDDSFFILIRQVGERMQIVLSDALMALEYEIAAEVLELLVSNRPKKTTRMNRPEI